jgi:peptidoglycan/xylan/chitin deacetylase (PgdA/CDA1 family)
MPRLVRTLIGAAAVATLVPLIGLAAPSPAQAAPSVRVTGPAYDSPGSTVAVVVTTSARPSGYSLSFRVSAGGIGGVCNGAQWKHSTGWSQRCWVTLPARTGTWSVSARAVFTRSGYATQYSTYGSKSIVTKGYASAPVSAATRDSIERCWNTTSRVQLTFDDGNVGWTNLNSMLATLKAYNVRGRFLPTGEWAAANPLKMATIRNAGHLLGNHTYSHPALNSLSSSSVRWQISHGVGATTSPKLIRPPYGAGAYSQRVTNDAAALGYRVCHWSTDTSDYAGVSATTIISKVLTGDAVTAPARAGGVVLMHMSGTNTPSALPGLIRGLRAKGLVLEPLH